jgi:hypothetical protein
MAPDLKETHCGSLCASSESVSNEVDAIRDLKAPRITA